MEYSEKFKDVIELNTYIGTGNPNSQILVIGKEVATDVEEGSNVELENKNLQKFNSNCADWLKNINENISQDNIPKWEFEKDENNPLYAFKGVGINKEGHTWRKYQKLNNYIFNKKDNKKINFQEEFFITEMSILPSKTTGKAQKKANFHSNLAERKKTFLESDFIQDFPIVILACSNYIVGEEITSIFKVDFFEEKGSGKQKYWIHWNSDKTKIVIHTRQLSGNVSNNLLLGISNEVKKLLK
jgi:hypothetical protein